MLFEPLMRALGSRVLRQADKVKELSAWPSKAGLLVFCKNKESAEMYATLIERTETFVFPHVYQSIKGEIGAEGWGAMRRAAEYMSAAGVRFIQVSTDREAMGTGRKEDLKAIWDIASFWGVQFEKRRVDFNKEDGAQWEGRWIEPLWERVRLRAGLSQVIEID